MSKKNKQLGFKCGNCDHDFRTDNYRRVDNPQRESHPYDYFATCPECGKEDIELQPWQMNLLKAWSKATGPKNTDVTRFNAISHGLTAKVAQYHPARPGRYEACDGCEYFDQVCGQDGNLWCLKRTEIYMRHRLAVSDGEIKPLQELNADTQAGAYLILENMFHAIIQDGVRYKTPVTTTNPKTGETRILDYIDDDGALKVALSDIKAHPLLKLYIEMLSKNGLTLTDMMLTKKQQGEDANIKGYLDNEEQNRAEQQEKQELFAKRQEKLLNLVENSTDPLAGLKTLSFNNE